MQKRIVFGLIVLALLSAAAVLYKLADWEPAIPAQGTATTTPVTVATTTDIKPVATTTPAAHPTKDILLKAYLTGYAWPDNTPPGSAISHPVIHQEAGG